MFLEETHCNLEYPIYGNIDRNISVKRLSWNEGEKIDYNRHILPNIENSIIERCKFLFLHRAQNYPISFRYKKYGMWGEIERFNDQKFYNTNEKMIDLNRYCAYYGICEIKKEQLEVAFDLLPGGFLLFSNDNYLTIQSIEKFLRVSDNKFEIDFAEAINYYCQTGKIVATTIIGTDGVSINFFRKKDDRVTTPPFQVGA
jgi:hypothetical protein